MKSLRRDTRGLTTAFVKLLASLGVGAMLIWAFYQVATPVLTEARANAPGGLGGMAMNNWFQTGFRVLPLLFLLVAFFGFIVRAVYERGRAG